MHRSVAAAASVDLTMTKGVNYPRGPLHWADAVGIGHLCTVMDNLRQVYGEDRYRLAPLLQRMHQGRRRYFATDAPVELAA
jgi:3-hydroxybutyryl-CoA dehydrogenase